MSDSQSVSALSLRGGSLDIGKTFWQQWQQYQDYLYRCCIKWMGGNSTDAEDALSRAMLKAWEKVQKYAGEITNFKAWLTTLTRNLCVDIHRERSRGANRVEDIQVYASSVEQELVRSEDTPEIAMETGEKRIVIRRAIDNLPTRLRETFILHFSQELSYQEIAQQQEISYQNVCKRISQARKILQEELRGYFIGEDGTDTDKSVPPAATESEIGEMSQENAEVEPIVGEPETNAVAVEEVRDVADESPIEVAQSVLHSETAPMAALRGEEKTTKGEEGANGFIGSTKRAVYGLRTETELDSGCQLYSRGYAELVYKARNAKNQGFTAYDRTNAKKGDNMVSTTSKPQGVIEQNPPATGDIICWVRDTHTDAEYAVMTQRDQLLTALQLETPIPQSELMKADAESQPGATIAYFNILYRCDFALPDLKFINGNTKFPIHFIPSTPTYCDIAIPVTCKATVPIENGTTKPAYILGLDPFSLVQGNPDQPATHTLSLVEWTDNHLTGKIINCAFAGDPNYQGITQPSALSSWRTQPKLYAGLLHGAEGAPAPKDHADAWLTQMKAKQPMQNTEAVVLLALINDPDTGVGWYGIYQNPPTQTYITATTQWRPVSALSMEPQFWKALVETGAARNKGEADHDLGTFFGGT